MATYSNTATAPCAPDLTTVETTLATTIACLVRTDASARTYEDHDLDAGDRLGRRIGARVCRFTSTLNVWHDSATGEPAPRGADWHTPRPAGGFEPRPGTVWCYEPHALRNGKVYGASQPTSMFDSEADREAAVARYLRDARKRAAKAQAKATTCD